MRFYTNVCLLKGKIAVRYIDDDKRKSSRVNYSPYLFIPNNSSKKTDYKTIHGKPVAKLDFENHWEMKEFIKRYEGVDNFEYYGMAMPIYTYIYDNSPEKLSYDPTQIRIVSLDIEVDSSDGFPDLNPAGVGYGTNQATKEITVIGLRSRGRNIVFGTREYKVKDKNTEYMQLPDEQEMLKAFLTVWNDADFWQPDIVTGWNCIPLSQSVWGDNRIYKLSELNVNNLFESKLIKKYPVSVKERWDIELYNGRKISSSGEHKFPVKIISPDDYTNFKQGKKSTVVDVDLKVREMRSLNKNIDIYFQLQLRENKNKDNKKYSLNELYLAGLIYTDGSLRSKEKLSDGYKFYQSDIEFMNELTSFGVDTKISGPYKGCYHRSIKRSLLGNTHFLIYNDTVKKLDLYELSTLSYIQFTYFVAGLLDGDGCNINNEHLSWCNYNNDISTLAELCYWNGIFCTERKNSLYFVDYNFEDFPCLKLKRWRNFKQKKMLSRCSKQKSNNILYKKIGNNYWVKIKSIIYDGTSTRMMDLETDSHYFNTAGIKTHNCSGFDVPYLVRRIEMILGEDWAKMMSPWRQYSYREFQAGFGHTQIEYNLAGIDVLDYLALYKKFSYTPQASYRLDHIANYELKEGKRSYSQYKSLQEFYEKDFQGFVDYNIQDNALIDKLEEKKGFIKLVMAMAYDAKINFKDCFTPTRVWDVIIHNYLMRQGIVVPKMKHSSGESIEGAYCKEPILGMHKLVVSYDLNSLYPHLIQMYNVSPETYVRTLPRVSVSDVLNGEFKKDQYKEVYDKNQTIATPGHIFTKDKQGFLPAIMEKMYNDRIIWKKRMIEAKKQYEITKTKELENEVDYCKNMQHQLKITLNAGYGVLCNNFFRWYDVRLGESITLSGQVSIRWIINKMNSFLNGWSGTNNYDYIIACDTDSMYLRLENFIKKHYKKEDLVSWIDEQCEKLFSPYIDNSFKELAEYVHAYNQTMIMKRETIASKGIWTGKKHYALNALDIEGVRYKTPELKIVGLESVKSSTPAACRVAIKDAIKIIMNKEEPDLIKYIDNFKLKHKTLSISEIAFPRSVDGLTKYADSASIYKKGTPIQVKGSLLYNKFLKENNLTNTYQSIVNKEKIKFVYLKLPNPIKEKVISFITEPPKELGIEKYIDYDIMFEKSFIIPLKGILDTIGWHHEQVDTIERFLI